MNPLTLKLEQLEERIAPSGLGNPGNNTVLPESPLFAEEYRSRWAQFDPDQANQLLDEIGLSELQKERVQDLVEDWEAARRHPVVRRWADPTWDWRGYLDAPATLSLLARAPVLLAPFVDGLTGRRTSAFAAASVGAPVVSSAGPLFDPALDVPPFFPAGTLRQFCELAAARFHERSAPTYRGNAAESHRQRFGTDRLDRRLLDLLLPPSRR